MNKLIKEKRHMHIFDELKERGLVFQTTDEEALRKALEEGQVSYYTGYDPTADSLHLGHLVAILTSRRLQLAGHKPYALVGGATGLIGDPSFKDAERSLQTKETVQEWVRSIQGQLSRFLDFENGDNKAEMVNNYDWFGSISFIDFLRDVGKYFTVNAMMSKESVKKRIETGISYTEFAYQIMQGYDFYELNDKTRGKEVCISNPKSKVQVYIVPTNEELIIARDTVRLLGL